MFNVKTFPVVKTPGFEQYVYVDSYNCICICTSAYSTNCIIMLVMIFITQILKM